ncbi:MAG TPA: YggS family pyridoxal phosphate enzyme [Planctomycetota bacterium]|nr:YggS family pyridoxal phosphate enzyme [Planctomycetota bacterium]
MKLDRLRSNLDAVRARIAAACGRSKRDPSGVTLIVVTKSVPPELLPRLAELGVGDIGENRPVEALARVGALRGYRRHMIGHLQTNKLAKTLAWADCIHSVDRPSLLGAMEQSNKKVPIFVQVNVSGEASKGGYGPQDVERAVAQARRTLEVLGLMTMAPEGADARPHFRRLREMAARTGVPNLSMGMSQDYEVAVEEGATHVRIGTAIFEGVLI